MSSFEVLNLLKGKKNSISCLVILTLSSAVSLLLYKRKLVSFLPQASSIFNRKRKQGASSVSIKEHIPSSDLTCNIKEQISSSDLLCNLPECIKHEILVYLPIKEAVRTSILSKNWRYTWTTIPDLVIDCRINSNSHENSSNEDSMNIKFVDKLLSCHKGNLHKFKLSATKLRSPSMALTMWMKTLLQKNISELILEAHPDEFFIINISAYSSISYCLKLKVLVLSGCFMFLPLQYFVGFRLLHTIDVKDCTIIPDGIEALVSYSPLLEKLKFKPKTFIEEVFKIRSSSLRELTIYGKFEQVSLLTPKLCTANFVTPKSLKATSRTVELRGNFIKLPVYINNILSDSPFCYVFQKYPPTLNYLTTMVMILKPSEQCIYSTNRLFREFLMLQKLIVYLEPVDSSFFSGAYKIQDKLFPSLREATIIPFFSSDTVFEFAKIVLSNAPVLDRLMVRGEIKDCEVSKLNKIHKLSSKAEIKFSKSCFSAEGKFQGCCCSMCDIMAW